MTGNSSLASASEGSDHDEGVTPGMEQGGAMSDTEEKEYFGGRAPNVVLAAVRDTGPSAQPITFNRRELNEILQVYGRKVADGEWRDYAIDQLREMAVFSIFRRSSEMPVYRIVKQPRLARKQGAYSIVAATGLILKRGPDLGRVLRVLDPGLRLVVA
jgi:hypothetical protein